MNRKRVVSKIAGCLAVMLVTLAANCPPSQEAVVINYEQFGACNGYRETTGPGGSGPHHDVLAGPKAAFVVFRILTFNNPNATSFNYDPERIHILGTTPQEFVDSGLTLATFVNVRRSAPASVPKGKSGHDGYAVIRATTGDVNGAAEAFRTNYLLQYERAAGDPPILMTKVPWTPPPPNAQVTENCLALPWLR